MLADEMRIALVNSLGSAAAQSAGYDICLTERRMTSV